MKKLEALVTLGYPERRRVREHGGPVPDQANQNQDVGPDRNHPDSLGSQSQDRVLGKVLGKGLHSRDAEVDPGQDQ